MKNPLARSRVDPPSHDDPPNRFGDMRPVRHDDDERPSREDRAYGETIFNRSPVPLPRLLRRGKKR